ncbi:hypothetical protein STM14_3793 [Salmonella enterica subsp. enterica serovar Typhimurium str. 14028S]|uniref:Uncharacterized protein n=1 Tax=Salmonella typhimurium (strain 14028s / SGSC 2262) TaxID=588858 RepID=A0A0F6B6P9_SALT1|nr:hypothetical protein STM14_3793 [Salmonella enterica subsp. enterica serovar Typhimurium str. 14028S]
MPANFETCFVNPFCPLNSTKIFLMSTLLSKLANQITNIIIHGLPILFI